MNILKIEDGLGYFLDDKGEHSRIDEITKEDLLRLVDLTLEEEDINFDEYDESNVKNHAHQIIYKKVYENLQLLRSKRQKFNDEVERLYLVDYERYKKDTSSQ